MPPGESSREEEALSKQGTETWDSWSEHVGEEAAVTKRRQREDPTAEDQAPRQQGPPRIPFPPTNWQILLGTQ